MDKALQSLIDQLDLEPLEVNLFRGLVASVAQEGLMREASR